MKKRKQRSGKSFSRKSQKGKTRQSGKGSRKARSRPAASGSRRKSRPGKAGAKTPKAPKKKSGWRSDARSSRRVKGTFEAHPRGYGFVRPFEESIPDLFIPPRYTGGALHGDQVEAEVLSSPSDERQWGGVRRILERSRSPVVGVFDGAVVLPRDSRFQAAIRVRASDAGKARPGEVVLAEVQKVGPRGVWGRVVEVLGDEEDPELEARIILRARGFQEEFSDEALREAESVPRQVTEEDLRGRKDLRGLFTITIDPESARDFDDAVSVERTASGYRLFVSIADVSHYVRPESAIDREAYERATSVYFPARAYPMLPESLSNHICSLKPEEDRLALTVEMDFDSRGRRMKALIYPSVIRSDHRLTYEEVEEMEHNPGARKGREDLWKHIEVMRELAERRTAIRRARGALELDVPEPVVALDARGEPETIKRSANTWSHRLIEEFMLAANETVASLMAELDRPMIYRIHEPPRPEAVVALAEVLAKLGFQLLDKEGDPEHISPRAFQRVLKKAEGTPYETVVKTLVLRAMMQARYHHKLQGHFGLAASAYCHFTSPIRRYPDLIAHRLVKELAADPDGVTRAGRGGKRPKVRVEPFHLSFSLRSPALEPLPEAAEHCSERERAAEDAEREMVEFYRARWAARHLGRRFSGRVSGVAAFGVFVELEEPFLEGLIPEEALPEEMVFREDTLELRSEESSLCFRLGDPVVVRIAYSDPVQRRILFALVKKG